MLRNRTHVNYEVRLREPQARNGQLLLRGNTRVCVYGLLHGTSTRNTKVLLKKDNKTTVPRSANSETLVTPPLSHKTKASPSPMQKGGEKSVFPIYTPKAF